MHSSINPTHSYYSQTLTASAKLPALLRSTLSSSFRFNPNPTNSISISSPSLSLSSLSIRPNSILPILSSPPNSISQSGRPGVEQPGDMDIDSLVQVAHSVADVAGQVLRKYFRQRFDIIDKDDHSPVTIADRKAEESMVSLITEKFPSHAIFGEENGWRCKEESADYVWVLDPIDGTKSFITGKPLFGTLISILFKGKPIIGIIDQPILKERWLGIDGKTTTLNGRVITTRTCSALSQAYLYTTSPHLFSGEAEEAFVRVRNKVKLPLYGCDCYAYALLASGFVDLVVESGLKPYDFLALVPVIEGAGGVITDWKGNRLDWRASPQSRPTSYNVVAAGDAKVHKEAMTMLHWS